jgi:uncharacterized phage protein gp47/JayE
MAIYGTKNKSQILVSMLDGLEKNAGISAIYPGSVARAFAEAFSSEVADLYEAFRFTMMQADLSTASGRNLDLIGDLYGVQRKAITPESSAERQSYNIEFSIDKPYSGTVIVPAGTMVYNDVTTYLSKQYMYRLSGQVIIPPGSTRAYGRVEPNFSDNSYVAPRGSLTRHDYVSPASTVVYCTNPKEVYSNVTSENDANYRRRIIASMRARTTGTAESVRFAALAVPGVKDVRIREGSYGIGSCDVIIVPEAGANPSTLPGAVVASLTPTKPVGIKLNARIAERVRVSIGANIMMSQQPSQEVVTAIQNQAALFAKRYINTMTVGSTLSISEIENQMKLASDSVMSVSVTSISLDGRPVAIEDQNLNTVTKYFVAGNLDANSVIIGVTNY